MSDKSTTSWSNPMEDEANAESPRKKRALVKVLEQSLGERLKAVKELKKFVDLSVFGTTAEADEAAFVLNEDLKRDWWGLLHPDTTTASVYNLGQMALIVYLLFTLPYNLAFDITTSGVLFWIDVIVDLALAFDVVLSMNRYYRHPRTNDLVTDKRAIRKQYMRSWFLVDVMAVIPFDYLVLLIYSWSDSDSSTVRNEVRTARLLRLTKLSRFARMSKLLRLKNLRAVGDVLLSFLKNLGATKLGLEFVTRLLGLCFVMVACMHLLGCIWLHMGLASIEAVAAADEILQNESLSAGVEVDAEMLNRNWMLREYGSLQAAESVDNWGRYVDAAYWTVVTVSSVGYGDIIPTSPSERLYVIIVIILGIFLYAYIVGSFTNMLSNMGQDKSNFDSKMRSVMQLMKHLNVPDDLETQVATYYEYKYANHTMFNAEVMNELPARIRADLILHRFAMVIDKVPFFHGLREDAVVDICSRLLSHSVMPDHHIISKGEPYRDLVILTAGKARTEPLGDGPSSDDASDTLRGRALRGGRRIARQMKQGELDICVEYAPGSFFGELEFLGFSEVRAVTVVALRFVEVSTLSPEAIEPVLDIHIGLRRRLMRYGKLKKQLDDMIEDSDTIDAVSVEAMKEQIEEQFDESTDLELRGIFNDVDDLHDGKLGPAEFANALEALGIGLDPEHVELEFNEIVKYKSRLTKGGNIDTEIDFEDFEEFWTTNENRMRARHHDMNQVDMARDTARRIQKIEHEVATTRSDVADIKALLTTLAAK